MVDGLIELTDRAHGWRSQSDLQIRKFRGGAFLRGRHAYKITRAGVIVYPRLEELYAFPSTPDAVDQRRVSTGIARLDAMLGGGLPAASTTMLMGPPGAGKTTTGLHFLSAASAPEPGLLFGFYETPARIAAKAADVCAPLSPLIRDGVVEILWQPPTGGLLDEYGEMILQAVRRRGVRRLFIDGLTSFREAAIEPTRLHHFFSALANELRALGVTTMYSLEVPNILGPAVRVPVDDASSLAENMILLRFHERRSKFFRLISVLKLRDSNFDPALHEFSISAGGLVVSSGPESAETILSTTTQSHGADDAAAAAGESDEAARRGD